MKIPQHRRKHCEREGGGSPHVPPKNSKTLSKNAMKCKNSSLPRFYHNPTPKKIAKRPQ